MTLPEALAGALAVALLAYYLGGHLLVSRLGDAEPAPDGVAGSLPFDSPPVLVLDGEEDDRAAGAGPPGFRRVLVGADLLEEDELATAVAVVVGKFETKAFDVAVLAHLVRVELLLGSVAFLLQSAQVDRHPAVTGAVVTGALSVLYLLQRIVLWRVGRADQWASGRVGRDAVTSLLESETARAPTWLPDLLRLQPRPERRLARLRRRE